MKKNLFFICSLLILTSFAQADHPLPEDYVDLSGIYANPQCRLDQIVSSKLLGDLHLISGMQETKLFIKQEVQQGIENGEEFTFVSIKTHTEDDKSKNSEIEKVVFDSRTGKSMDKGYFWKEHSLLFQEKEINKERDLLGYRARMKIVNRESIKPFGKKLLVDGTIEFNELGVMFYLVPFHEGPKTYSYRCTFDRLN